MSKNSNEEVVVVILTPLRQEEYNETTRALVSEIHNLQKRLRTLESKFLTPEEIERIDECHHKVL